VFRDSLRVSDVQRFFFGGGAGRPGASATTENLMIGGNVATQLRG
jgi:hypothetical protein